MKDSVAVVVETYPYQKDRKKIPTSNSYMENGKK